MAMPYLRPGHDPHDAVLQKAQPAHFDNARGQACNSAIVQQKEKLLKFQNCRPDPLYLLYYLFNYKLIIAIKLKSV
jgi:hypothetical protein